MQMTAPSRPSFARRWFAPTLSLILSLCLLAGAVPSRAGAPERRAFPNSFKSASREKKLALAPSAAAPASAKVEFQVALKMRDFAKLQDRIARGEHLSDKELREHYLPLAADHQAVVKWAEAQGLTVLDHDPRHLSVRVSGTVAAAEHALATRYERVNVDGKEYLAAQGMPSLPARIAAPVLGINGLQPYLKVQTNSVTVKDQAPYIPSDILDAYGAKGLTGVDGTTLTGRGQTIAVLIDTFPADTDLTAFWTNTGSTQNRANVTEINVNNVTPLPAPSGEETLDVSWAGGIAPAAKIRVYAVGSMELTDLDKGLQRIISDMDTGVTINELTVSTTMPETFVSPDEVMTESQYYAILAAQGVSIFVAAGDGGSAPDATPQVYYPASDPSVTAVGGTTLTLNTLNLTGSQETAWDGTAGTAGTVADGTSTVGASGGGESLFFNVPAYQTGLTVGADTDVPVAMRAVPDVSSAADPTKGAYLVFTKTPVGGVASTVPTVITSGGTSWSAPTWAGFGALINQARELAGVPDVGLLNPSIYPLLDTGNFHDIVGNSTTGATATVANPAVFGYDEITGLGTPVMSNLVATLTNVASLEVDSFAPQSGIAGTQVTLRGAGLDRTFSVRFNGTSAVTFAAVSGTELTVTVPNGATTGPIAVTARGGTVATSAENFTVLPVDAGANDNFVNAQVIGIGQTRLIGSNVGATKEAGEPDHAGNPGGASVWYKWTSPKSNAYTFNTIGSSFDTLLAVYTGADVADLTPVVSNDDAAGTASSVVFQAPQGTTYYIAVDGVQQGNGVAAQGTVVLNEVEDGTMPVVNDFTPTTGSTGTSVQIFGANLFAVSTVEFGGVSAPFVINSVSQITATVPAGALTGRITLLDTLGDRVRSSGIFTVVNPPMNDDFAAATPLVGTAPSKAGSNVGATKEPGEPDHADNPGGTSVWFTWTAPASGPYRVTTFGSTFDTLLAVYTGDDVAALTPVASNDDAGPLGTSATAFTAVAGTVYHLAVDGYDGATGNYQLNLQAVSGAPAITSLDPAVGGAGTDVAIEGSGFLTTTGVRFNGVAAPGFLVNSDTQITVTAPTGVTTGHVTVTATGGTATSPGVFTVVPRPGNDDFVDSIQLVGAAPLNVSGYTEGATKEAGEPVIVAGDAGGHSVWFTWTAPVSGTVTVTTRGSDFDTLLGIYTGSTVSNLTPVAVNDDDPEGGVTSAITLSVLRGTTYRIVIDGANGDAGNYVLNILNTTATLNLYSTAFEAAEGFTVKQPLVGQNGWLALTGGSGEATALSPGGNGIIANAIPGQGQQAFVGNLPPTDGSAAVAVYHPITYPPADGNYPLVNFSTQVRFTNSTNGQHDRFGFAPGHVVTDADTGDLTETPYFTLFFDESSGVVFYVLDNRQAVATGATFSNDVTYALQMLLDFQNNVWSATLNGKAIVTNAPLSTLGKPDTLTAIAAEWSLANAATPGDNSMAFDNYTVETPQAQAPAILVQPTDVTTTSGSTVSFSVVADGDADLVLPVVFQRRGHPRGSRQEVDV